MAKTNCEGHPAGAFDPMGETVYCDGSCKRGRVECMDCGKRLAEKDAIRRTYRLDEDADVVQCHDCYDGEMAEMSNLRSLGVI